MPMDLHFYFYQALQRKIFQRIVSLKWLEMQVFSPMNITKYHQEKKRTLKSDNQESWSPKDKDKIGEKSKPCKSVNLQRRWDQVLEEWASGGKGFVICW